MATLQIASTGHRSYLILSTIAIACALVFQLSDIASMPVLGAASLLPVVLLCALAGYPLLLVLRSRAIGGFGRLQVNWRSLAQLVALGAALAVPPVVIDLLIPFPRDMNIAPPWGLAFYPAIGFVAEVLFHIVPIAVFAIILPRRIPVIWLLLPAVFTEPVFQAYYNPGAAMQSWLVIGNVTLVSSVQLWLFQRHGFAAMIGLRIVFYLFWHIIWGSTRLAVLF